MKRNIFLTAFFIAMALAIIPAKAQWTRLRELDAGTDGKTYTTKMESGVVSWDLQKTYGFAYFIKTEPWGVGILRLCEFDNTTGKIIRQIVDYNGETADNSQVTKDGKYLITSDGYKIIKIDLQTGNSIKIKPIDDAILIFRYSPLNGKILIYNRCDTSYNYNSIKTIDENSGKILNSFQSDFFGHFLKSKIKSFVSSPSCKYVGITAIQTKEDSSLVSCILIDTDEMRIIDTLQSITVARYLQDDVAIKQFAFSDDETKYAVLDSAYNLKVYSLPDRKLLGDFVIDHKNTKSKGVDFDSSGNLALVRMEDGNAVIDIYDWKKSIKLSTISDPLGNFWYRIPNTMHYSTTFGKILYYMNMEKAENPLHTQSELNVISQNNTLIVTSKKGIVNIEILSMDGKLLIENQYDNEQNIRIPLEVSAGAYIVRVKIGDKYYSQKFIWGE
jgi:hypothetical protein